MRKFIISLVIALIICFSIVSFSALAAGTITATLSNGNITYNGSGFDPDTEYFIRLLNSDSTHLISMLTVVSNSSGQINATKSVGSLDGGTYNVMVNDASGDTVGSSSLQVQAGSSGGGSSGGSSGGGSGGGSDTSGGSSSGNAGSNDNDNDGSNTGGGSSGASNSGSSGSPSSANTARSSGNTNTFGAVPQTGVPGITGLVVAMCMSIGLTSFFVVNLVWQVKINKGKAK